MSFVIILHQLPLDNKPIEQTNDTKWSRLKAVCMKILSFKMLNR